MGIPDGPQPRSDAGTLAEARAEALDVVSDALQWQLNETRWQSLDHILASMDAAVADGDVAALTAATADLELVGPVRLTRIGATPVMLPPAPVRDRLNRLVHSLGGVPADEREEPA